MLTYSVNLMSTINRHFQLNFLDLYVDLLCTEGYESLRTFLMYDNFLLRYLNINFMLKVFFQNDLQEWCIRPQHQIWNLYLRCTCTMYMIYLLFKINRFCCKTSKLSQNDTQNQLLHCHPGLIKKQSDSKKGHSHRFQKSIPNLKLFQTTLYKSLP